MQRFQIGDKVRILRGDNDALVPVSLGDIDTITEYVPADKNCANVEYYRLKNHLGIWFDDDIMLVNNDNYIISVVGRTVCVGLGSRTGKAVCSPDDEFDLATGIALAISRLDDVQKGDEYYYVTTYGTINRECFEDKNVDIKRKAIGNMFKTKKSARVAAQKIKEALRVR